MLLELENPNKENLAKLLDFARQHHLNLTIVDDKEGDLFLPGKPLNDDQLKKLILESRESGIINMNNAHSAIRNSLNGN